LFDENNDLINSHDVEIDDNEYYLGCPLCKEIYMTDFVNISDYHDENVWVGFNGCGFGYDKYEKGCEHRLMLCYGNNENNEHKYCVKK
jgi:hypothetical protein